MSTKEDNALSRGLHHNILSKRSWSRRGDGGEGQTLAQKIYCSVLEQMGPSWSASSRCRRRRAFCIHTSLASYFFFPYLNGPHPTGGTDTAPSKTPFSDHGRQLQTVDVQTFGCDMQPGHTPETSYKNKIKSKPNAQISVRKYLPRPHVKNSSLNRNG